MINDRNVEGNDGVVAGNDARVTGSENRFPGNSEGAAVNDGYVSGNDDKATIIGLSTICAIVGRSEGSDIQPFWIRS